MKTGLLALTALISVTLSASAQVNGDQSHLQFHGFATQSFLKSSSNNYLSTNSSGGSFQWSEAALNVTDQVSRKLRIGVQFHYLNLGDFGSNNLNLDWASGDFRINRQFKIRAGKVKIRWGLYNDTQDADPGYLWALLPESIYAIDYRATNLSQLGAELYGEIPLGKSGGRLEYSGYDGNYFLASDDGYMAAFVQSGVTFTNHPWGKTPGFDLRWHSPIEGLVVGGSLMIYDLKGKLADGTLRQPLTYWPTYYAQYDLRRLSLSGQYMKLVQYTTTTQEGSDPSTSGVDQRAWFATAIYHFTDKWQVGGYRSNFLIASAHDNSDPANFSDEWVASSRYEFNSNFYGKLEGHYMGGNAAGFYAGTNPDGLKSHTNLLVAKLGFVF